MLSKQAKFRIKHAKRSQLKALSDAVDMLANFEVITIKKASAVDRFIEKHGGRRS
tara:strand:- start:932 stop:1096 length:165 start_codon:yes stop_codon:yes gene_type:complete